MSLSSGGAPCSRSTTQRSRAPLFLPVVCRDRTSGSRKSPGLRGSDLGGRTSPTDCEAAVNTQRDASHAAIKIATRSMKSMARLFRARFATDARTVSGVITEWWARCQSRIRGAIADTRSVAIAQLSCEPDGSSRIMIRSPSRYIRSFLSSPRSARPSAVAGQLLESPRIRPYSCSAARSSARLTPSLPLATKSKTIRSERESSPRLGLPDGTL